MSSDSGWPTYLTIAIVVSVILLILNALATAAMSALDYIDRNKIKEMNEDDPDNKGLMKVMLLQRKPSHYHYANYVLNILTIVVVAITFNLIFYSKTDFKILIAENIVMLLVFIGLIDILPKKLASQSSEEYGLKLAGYQNIIYYITKPIVFISTIIANFILVILRKETKVDEDVFSEDKVMSMLDKGQETGEINEEGRKMIDSIFEFDDLLAYEIMTPRTDVFFIDLEDDKEEYFDQLMELRHSRIPVCEGDADNIVGILHIKDYLFKASTAGFDNVDIKEIMRDAYFAPETKNIDSLFIELQKEKQHIAILIDEYGGFSGLVSVEDIIEQIVGDIDDEFDEEDHVIERINDNTYIVDGNVYLDDLDDEIGVHIESDNSETISGFIIDLLGEIPKEGVHYSPIEYENYLFTILQIKDRRIEKIRVVIESEANDL